MQRKFWILSLCASMILLALPAWAGGSGEIAFDEDSTEVLEASGVAMVVIERSRGEDGAVTIDWATTGGTATAGADYTAVGGTLSWGDQDESNRVVEVPILDDSEAEGAESIELMLSNPTGGATIRAGRGSSVVVILANDGGTGGDGDDGDDGDDPGNLKFDEDSFEVLEEAGMAVIRVERSNGEGGVVSVDYSISAGSATEGSDYTAVSGTLMWANGDGGTKTFNVPILDDAETEGNETATMVLSNATGGAGIDAERGISTLVILASDGGTVGDGGGDAGNLKFDESSFEVLESAGVAIIRVERSNGESGAVTVDYTTGDITATDGSDYTGVSGTLSWAAGDGTDMTFVVPILDDTVAEGDEILQLTLLNPTGGAGLDPERDTAIIRILANDGGNDGGGGTGPAGVIKFDETSFEVIEEAGTALIVVERSQGEDGVVTVEYSTAGVSATDGADFVGTSGTLTWAANDGADKTFSVPILDDSAAEGNEIVQLSLSNVTGGAVIDSLRGEADLVILASDSGSGGTGSPGIFKFSSAAYQSLEQGGMAVITVERSQGEDGAASVSYASFDGSAIAGADYTAVSGTLNWGAGDGSTKTFLVPILDDLDPEGNETVQLSLTSSTGAGIDPQRDEATLTISDDDNTNCPAGPNTLCLLGGRFQVDIQYTVPSGDVRRANAIVLSDKSGLFFYNDRSNFEFLVKAIDACDNFGAFWLSYAATTTLQIEVRVEDTVTGQTKIYRDNRAGAAEPIFDTTTFTACP